MTIAIKGIGLATAQGSVSEILRAETPRVASELPWTPNTWNVSRVCFPAIESSLTGVERWQALAMRALNDVGGSGQTPLLVASCNGSASDVWEDAFDTSALLAGTPWAGLPVFSSSCASGIHALFAARALLMSGAVDEVLVLAVDILARSNHENFESLRVLAERVSAPWQSTSLGFVLGEAAVVLRVGRGTGGSTLHGPELGSELVGHDGLSSVLERVSAQSAGLILGQGTGPFANDAAELAAFAAFVDKSVPITTPLMHFGHTLGASGLLAIALGTLIHRTRSETSDHRTYCRALNGACGATLVGGEVHAIQRRKIGWKEGATPGPLMNETLKQLATEATAHRPPTPPDVLIVRIAKPLTPPPSAIINGRLLPSAVLEITPGFASQLIARCWGFSGPALCLVGNVDLDPYGLTNAFRESGLETYQVNLGDNRAIEWNVT